ncbi:MAG: hypothetical protein CO139_00260 [Candidatus Moranbacteria bacterium CG_4_9_14_3_um_filter_36_9]|nr:MAG: hypothetical protein CO139_00260 [Candidatus Moranbacteria bacterium CG_4_9_14_3_um_filter_36_9]
MGGIVLFCSIVFVLVYHKNTQEIIVAVFLLALSLFIQRRYSFIIFHHTEFVEKKINEALNLLKLENERRDNTFFIKKTNTSVTMLNLGMITILSFKANNSSPSEVYVINILIKFQARS